VLENLRPTAFIRSPSPTSPPTATASRPPSQCARQSPSLYVEECANRGLDYTSVAKPLTRFFRQRLPATPVWPAGPRGGGRRCERRWDDDVFVSGGSARQGCSSWADRTAVSCPGPSQPWAESGEADDVRRRLSLTRTATATSICSSPPAASHSTRGCPAHAASTSATPRRIRSRRRDVARRRCKHGCMCGGRFRWRRQIDSLSAARSCWQMARNAAYFLYRNVADASRCHPTQLAAPACVRSAGDGRRLGGMRRRWRPDLPCSHSSGAGESLPQHGPRLRGLYIPLGLAGVTGW